MTFSADSYPQRVAQKWFVEAIRWYVEEHLVWPSHWFLLTLGGMLPPLLNQVWARSAIGTWQTAAFSTLLEAKTLLDELSVSATIARHDATAAARDPASRP